MINFSRILLLLFLTAGTVTELLAVSLKMDAIVGSPGVKAGKSYLVTAKVM